SGLFVSEYYRNLKIEFQRLGREMPECFKSEEFRKMAYQVGALSFFYVMMHDIKEKNLSSEQQKAVVSLTEVMLR
ncbi:MAG: hypothetical protein Q8R37_00525, partial [Nanoarchaeota archaeon]|nr:hypothetical protein [Nanoarchaeota archaeon]